MRIFHLGWADLQVEELVELDHAFFEGLRLDYLLEVSNVVFMVDRVLEETEGA